MSGFPKSTISKRGSASSFRTRKAKRDDDEGEECCVCFQNPSDADSPCCRWKRFPCAHRTCELCFARLQECPICRTGKDGTPGIERQRTRDAADAAARAASAPPTTVIFFQGGGGGHPFSEADTIFRVAGLPPALMQNVSQLLAAGMDFERARGSRRAGRPLSHGERQQRAARLMQIGETLRIEDLLGRRVNP
jgi:hypothetical protein